VHTLIRQPRMSAALSCSNFGAVSIKRLSMRNS